MDSSYGEIVFYPSADNLGDVVVRLADETVWLTLNQMSDLFERDKSVISRHLRIIFQTGELDRNSTVAKNATVQTEGNRKVTRKIEWFNLDVIISVGYRVNSKRGTHFRIWATRVLREHLVEGYTFNQRRLAEKGVGEAQQVLQLLATTLENHDLIKHEGREVLSLVNRYAKTWSLLLKYDEQTLGMPSQRVQESRHFEFEKVRSAITSLKQDLLARGEATEIFGAERDDGLEGILGAIFQTFDGQDLYPGIEEKAAHLLYFIVKDHPFTDGNKRIGSFVFTVEQPA